MKLSHTLPLSALSLALLPAGLALAAGQDAALKLPETLISANRDVQQRDASSTASTVFTRADIERLQPASVSDLLRRVPGVQVTDNGAGSLASLYIRGTKSAQSLLLVDGMRIASASSGDSNLQFLNVDQIERVEVLRGPRSAVYGADAIGGVVQIISKRGEGKPRPFAGVGLGSRGTVKAAAGRGLWVSCSATCAGMRKRTCRACSATLPPIAWSKAASTWSARGGGRSNA